MQRTSDNFPAVWRSLSETQRRFLLATYEIDKRLSHGNGVDKVLAPIGWRTVGLMCRVGLDEVDELVRELANLRLVLILDAEIREVALISGQELRELMAAERRRRSNWAALAGAILAAVVTVLWLSRS
jgi:hypothetical protein